MPPVRLPDNTMFCPGCLKLLPMEQWDNLVSRNITCDTGRHMCFRKVYEYCSRKSLYEHIRNELYPRNDYGYEVKAADA